MADIDVPAPLTRVPTGIIGLDTIMHGGFFQGGVYLVVGQPGTGKTILGNQLAFQHLATGGRALYITLMAESHTRMFAHLQSQAFFDLTQVGEQLKYFSAFSALDKEGLDGLSNFLRREMREQRVSLLVLDGLTPLGEFAPSSVAFERFLERLQAYTQSHKCVTVLFSQPHAELGSTAYTMVDGVLELHYSVVGSRTARELILPKFRGSAFLEGRHGYTITDNGLVVAPRIEAVYPVPHTAIADPLTGDNGLSLVDTGVDGLNSMLNGGLGCGLPSEQLLRLPHGQRELSASDGYGHLCSSHQYSSYPPAWYDARDWCGRTVLKVVNVRYPFTKVYSVPVCLSGSPALPVLK